MTTRFSASQAARLMACPGSANLELAIPGWIAPVDDPDKGAKGKGHFLHEILANLALLPVRDLINFNACLAYLIEVRSRRRFKVLTEDTRTAEWLQSKPSTSLDVALYVQDELHIFDWKTGKIPVDATDNVQAMFYAVTWSDLAPKATGVHIHIVQPWAADPKTGFDGISHWYADTATLLQFKAEAQKAEALVLQQNLLLHPGDHCTFCPANPHSRGDKGYPLCPVLMQLYYPRAVDEDEMLVEA